MKNNAIKQILKENLKSPEKEDFNDHIIQKLNAEQNKQRPIVFDERSIVNWFLFISGLVLFIYLQQESKPDTNAILIGCTICAAPIYLLIFNKIYSLKHNIR